MRQAPNRRPSAVILGAAVLAAALAGCRSRAPTAPPPRAVTVICAGDVMLARGVERQRRKHGDAYPLALVAPYLRQADLAIGNLEGPLTTQTARFPRINALRASPDLAGALHGAGFGVLSLANNHAIDYGRPGLEETIAALRSAGLTPVGAGATAAEADGGVLVPVAGTRVGIAAFSDFPQASFVVDPSRPTIALLSEEALRRTVPALRQHADVVIVSVHWGKEGDRTTSERQRQLAHLAVDLGATVVFGHHSHVRGEIEPYRGGLIAYCLGNLVFDEQSHGGNEGYLLRCRFRGARLAAYDVLPVDVRECQARPSGGWEVPPAPLRCSVSP